MKVLVLFIAIAVLSSVAIAYSCEPDEANMAPSSGMPGGWRSIPVDANVTAMAFNCSVQWNLNNTALNDFYKVACVRSAQVQVVAGLKYEFDTVVVETVCSTSTLLTSTNNSITPTAVAECAEKANGLSMDCVFDYLVQPWTNTYTLINAQCTDL